MDNNSQDDLNAGVPNGGESLNDNPGSGSQGGSTPASNGQDNPGGQDGSQTDPRDAKIKAYEQNIRALNKALIEARRTSNQPRGNPQGNNGQGQGQGNDPFADPTGQYAIALQLATGNLSRKLEDVYSLYPELPATEIARIRKNPWAFASFDSYINGDWQSAALEVEQALLDRADELASNKGGNGGQIQKKSPVNINPNPAGEPQGDANPGTSEDENPWTMPMDKLEKVAKKQLSSLKK